MNKRRKLNGASSGSYTPISAFAAAKARQQNAEKAHNDATASFDTIDGLLDTSEDVLTPIADPEVDQESDVYSEPHSPKSDQHGEEQQRWQDRLLCTWSGEPGSVLEESCDRIVIKLLEGQTVCFIGLYDLCVQRGAVEVCRATLYEGAKPQTIYAPSTHALPIIRCISSAVISLVSVPSAAKRMGLLQQFSPLFRRIWNDWPDQHAYPDDELKRRTFSWIAHPSDDPLQRPLRPLEIPPEFNIYLENKRNAPNLRDIVAMVGPRSSGKSAICKALINSHLTRLRDPFQAVFFIDLDPTSQEVSLHGQVTATLIRRPLFGPAYTHQRDDFEIIRALPMPVSGLRDNEHHFVACALNLYYACLNYKPKDLQIATLATFPVVVKFPDLQQGFASAVTTSLLGSIQPTHTFSTARGPSNLVYEVATASANGTLHHISPFQVNNGTRTAEDLRDMQLLSMFHQTEDLRSSSAPLTDSKPTCISYAPVEADFAAVLCLPNLPPKGKLLELLNASIVSIVLVEDPEYMANLEIRRDGVDGIPYSNHRPGKYVTPLDPSKSRLCGVALVRSVSAKQQSLQILLPSSPSILNSKIFPPERTLLVHGCFGMPTSLLLERTYYEAYIDSSLVLHTAAPRKETFLFDDIVTPTDITAPFVEIGNGEDGNRREGEAKWKSRRFNMGGSG